MTNLVSAIFETRTEAEQAVGMLEAKGFDRDQMSVLMSDHTYACGRPFVIEGGTKAPEGAAIGATTGGAIGAIGASLAGLGVLAVPGLGFVAAGPIVAALAGAGAGGAAGTLVGSLIGAGIPERHAKVYGDGVQRGGILLGVTAQEGERTQAAESTLEAAGGVNLKTE